MADCAKVDLDMLFETQQNRFLGRLDDILKNLGPRLLRLC